MKHNGELRARLHELQSDYENELERLADDAAESHIFQFCKP